MNLTRLNPFLLNISSSRNQHLRKQANDVLSNMIANQSDEQVADPTVQAQGTDMANKVQNKDEVDQLIAPAFPELAKPENDDSSFGKTASAFITDLRISDLPKETQEDIDKFIPTEGNKDALVIQYGMVFSELLNKVDQHNFKLAEEHLKKELAEKGKRVLSDRFQEKINTKYILLLNDNLIDGNHFLALTKLLNITCSLRVLDLTPVRFQQAKTTTLQKLQRKKSR